MDGLYPSHITGLTSCRESICSTSECTGLSSSAGCNSASQLRQVITCMAYGTHPSTTASQQQLASVQQM